MNLIGVPLYSQATRLYRATLDGFGASNFHAKVDGISGTIVKTTNGNVFGGFTRGLWNGSVWVNDPSAYIFSLVNTYNYPCKLNVISTQAANSIRAVPSYGPAFGGGYDFYIGDQSNTNNGSGSLFGTSYPLPMSLSSGSVANSFLAGSTIFQTVEVEVYTINCKLNFFC